MEKLSYELTLIEEGIIRVTISKDGVELGSLYYEKAKKSFNNKPVGMNSWACVDAKVEGLYEVDESITPIRVMTECMALIRMAGY